MRYVGKGQVYQHHQYETELQADQYLADVTYDFEWALPLDLVGTMEYLEGVWRLPGDLNHPLILRLETGQVVGICASGPVPQFALTHPLLKYAISLASREHQPADPNNLWPNVH